MELLQPLPMWHREGVPVQGLCLLVWGLGCIWWGPHGDSACLTRLVAPTGPPHSLASLWLSGAQLCRSRLGLATQLTNCKPLTDPPEPP